MDQIQQIQKLLEDKKNILIVFRKNGGGDAIASAAALLLFLEHLGKPADAVSPNFKLPKNYSFLKKAEKIKPAIADLQKFTVIVDVKKAGVKELSYDLKDERLRIFITPKAGFITRDDIRTAQSDFKYDLIVALDTTDLGSLEALYENNTELFYKTPIINIDHHGANERFGQVNLVDVTATSTTEILYSLCKQLGAEYIDADVATALLSGMIAATRSFKTADVKPHTLGIAARLIELGADRDKIVRHLYQTRSISTLKLWGDALTHLQSDGASGLVWTSITRDNFARSGARETDLYDIVDEIITTSPEAKLILIFHEHGEPRETGGVHVLLRAAGPRDAKQLLSGYYPAAGGNHREAACVISGKPLKQVEEEVVREIKKQLL